MLGKLLKYEFKYTAKMILLFYGLLVSVTAFSSAAFILLDNMEVPDSMFQLPVIAFGISALYLLTLVATYLLTLIYLSVRFYQTMYSAQGYLTHTLPVTPTQTLHSKMIAAFIWMIGITLLTVASLYIFLYVLTDGTFFHSTFSAVLHDLQYAFTVSSARINITWQDVISLLFGCLLPLMLIFASISIGQLSSRHKIGVSIAAGIIIYYAEQLISAVLGVIYIFWAMDSFSFTSSTAEAEETFTRITVMEYISLAYLALFIVGLYVTCRIIVKKHINLE